MEYCLSVQCREPKKVSKRFQEDDRALSPLGVIPLWCRPSLPFPMVITDGSGVRRPEMVDEY